MIDLRESVTSAVANLGGHKLRSGLTTLGIVFGVGAVIAMLSIGAGAERQALQTIARLGLHNVVVRAKELKPDEAKEVRAKSIGVSLRDAEAIRQAVPGVELVAPKIEIRARKVFAAQASTPAKVFGVAAEQAQLVDLRLAEGRFLDPLDLQRHEQVAVIGDGVRRALFGFSPALGREIKVADVWLEVVGVLAPVGNDTKAFQGVELGSPSTAIFVPATTALRKFDRDPLAAPVDELLVRLRPEASGREAAALVHALLDQLHAGADDYELVVPEALLAESQRTQRMFDLVMGCIAGISLLVGGIGIMNIMLATVLERTREIGVRRAVGARRNDIVLQFLVEAFTLSALGGLTGIVMGTLIARLVAASAGWPTVVTWGSILLAAGVAMAVGLASGLYPAVRAAELDPIEALRYE